MKYPIFPLFLLLATTLPAQEYPAAVETPAGRGAAPVNPQSAIRNPQSTRAVVVGISDYQDDAIPDLRFADRDAEAFADWLRSPAGGGLPERNLVLLTNGQATLGKIVSALTGLIADAREGEQVILYFSGHGDVEANLFSQPGYLLCHDSKASVYMAGAFNIRDLQEVVNTLSLQNKAKVLVITDACRAGKLAGSSINGPQLTSANLAKQFANETKVLSCQPEEFSLEGAQWGGGRGVFSYHLVDGLSGMADRNQDDLVTLFELDMYLGERVPEEAAPHRQFPLTLGDRTGKLARVDAPTLAALRQAKTGQSPTLGGTGMKGWEDDIVAAADSATQALYFAFKGALDHDALIDTAGGYASAWDLLPLLLQRECLRELHGLLRRNLAAALQDEAQQALNALLDDDPYEANQWRYNPGKYARYPEYLGKSIELLGEQHYMYKTLRAKKLFFEAKTLALGQTDGYSGGIWNDSINDKIRSILKQGLQLEPGAAYLYYGIGNSYMNNMLRIDSFFYYHNNAIALSPTWSMPCLDIVNNYLFNLISSDWKTGEQYLLNALALTPDSYLLTERLAWLYQRMFRMDDAIELTHRMILLRPDLPNGFATLSSTYMHLHQYDLGAEYAHKALAIDSTVWPWPMGNLMGVNLSTRHYEDAFKIYNEARSRKLEGQFGHIIWCFRNLNLPELEHRFMKYYNAKTLGNTYEDELERYKMNGYRLWKQNRFPEAKALLLKYMLTRDTTVYAEHVWVLSNLAQIAWQEGKPDSAEYYFHQSINYYPELLSSWSGTLMFSEARYHYARFLLTQNRSADAEAQLRKAEEIDPHNPLNYYGMAALHAAQKHNTEALNWLAKALEWYYPDYDEIMAEPLFQKIRKTRRFKALMKQYFPDGSDRPKVEALARKYLPEIFEN